MSGPPPPLPHLPDPRVDFLASIGQKRKAERVVEVEERVVEVEGRFVKVEERVVEVERIIKLGGAAITNKAMHETLNGENLRSVSAAVAEVIKSSPKGMRGGRLGGTIIVHGAGSFGHQVASATGVARGGLHLPGRRRGFVETRLSVTKLNHLVVQQLVKDGVDACALPLFGSWSKSKGAPAREGIAAVREALNAGLVPVLHGDAVVDDVHGCGILSGDVVVERLALELRPGYVAFLTDVPGVFDRDPKVPGARPVPEVLVGEAGEWEAPGIELGAAAAHDVTGGIRTKVESAARIAASGVPVYIAKAGTEGGRRAVAGDVGQQQGQGPWEGTEVRPVE